MLEEARGEEAGDSEVDAWHGMAWHGMAWLYSACMMSGVPGTCVVRDIANVRGAARRCGGSGKSQI